MSRKSTSAHSQKLHRTKIAKIKILNQDIVKLLLFLVKKFSHKTELAE